MEQLEIHSKSYLVRWVNVSEEHTISWSIQPKKRSINFGVFKHPGTGATPNSTSDATFGNPSPELEDNGDRSTTKGRRGSLNGSAGVADKLQKLGMKPVTWVGRCEADQVAMGHYDVEGEGGMYGLVFDNTYSKQFSKTVTFVLMTFPTSAQPTSGHQSHFAQAIARKSSTSVNSPKPSPKLGPLNDSNESLPRPFDTASDVSTTRGLSSREGLDSKAVLGESFYTGVLSKKRRRRNQGYARRFFSLDYTSSTLSYYKNRNSSALRGAIPLSLVAIATDKKSRHISIDSGAEVWFLKAHSKKDFDGWRSALERAAQVSTTPRAPGDVLEAKEPTVMDPADAREWTRAETLVGTVSGITASVRRLAKDTDPKYFPNTQQSGSGRSSPSVAEGSDYFQSKERPQEKVAFWRRKSSSNQEQRPLVGRKVSAQSLAPPSPVPQGPPSPTRRSDHTSSTMSETHVHEHCMAILKDLDKVVNDFSALIADARQRRLPERRPTLQSRLSIESSRSQEFFDAEEDVRNSQTSGIMTMHREDELDGTRQEADDDAASIDSTSTVGEEEDTIGEQSSALPSRPHTLYPLPHSQVSRRRVIPVSKGAPPSLISFLRKNVGKDLSTIAMPVTSNEPLSLLQRQAEQMEYAHLLDSAGSLATAHDSPDADAKRLLYVTAFAISSLAQSRARERAVRKPFNPMLGETFELAREDLGFRFLAEKISHRPVRIACQAEGGNKAGGSPSWIFAHSPAPSQKFWGKSAELITEGKARVGLYGNNECYFWDPAHCFLRNIIAGEKYVEPVGAITVIEHKSGRRAVATFKAGGMFSGRSEDVTVEAFASDGVRLSLGLKGNWTTQLSFTGGSAEGEVIWEAGPLVDKFQTRYGLTSFATSLNEITQLEEHALPPTDSRLRPDQRHYEDGDVNEAETLKAKLEEGQRRRRRDMEGQGEQWPVRWFEPAGTQDGEEVWRAKEGSDGYWSVREAVVGFKGGKWDGVRQVFEV
ncbi:MAG: hypothetical protein M1828_007482 [Chrysothrix sp. TS-e1954]|nr:MAG: hypothetical protein M1828_007482 [Chrysothrix sp. TS-e1954]